jgi:hypothetical protein
MVFEKKVTPPPERAVMLKAAAAKQNSTKGETLRIVRDALSVQE